MQPTATGAKITFVHTSMQELYSLRSGLAETTSAKPLLNE